MDSDALGPDSSTFFMRDTSLSFQSLLHPVTIISLLHIDILIDFEAEKLIDK